MSTPTPESVAAEEPLANNAGSTPEPEPPKQPTPKKRHCTLIDKYKKPMGIMVILLLLVLNTVMVLVGIIQSSTSVCAIEPILPIFLVGTGIVGIISRVLLIIKYYVSDDHVILNRTLYSLLIVELIFLIMGSCWIFINFKTKQHSCNGAAFTWTFLIVIFYYIVLLSPIIVPCCIESYLCCFMEKLKVAR